MHFNGTRCGGVAEPRSVILKACRLAHDHAERDRAAAAAKTWLLAQIEKKRAEASAESFVPETPRCRAIPPRSVNPCASVSAYRPDRSDLTSLEPEALSLFAVTHVGGTPAMNIGEAARASGVSSKTIRCYVAARRRPQRRRVPRLYAGRYPSAAFHQTGPRPGLLDRPRPPSIGSPRHTAAFRRDVSTASSSCARTCPIDGL